MQWQWALSGAIPALAVMYYVDRLDAKRPEPRWSLRKLALIGALSVIPVVVVERFLGGYAPAGATYGAAFYNGVVVAAGVEELAKLLCVYWFIWHKPEFDERLDGIVYATRAGLGFAAVENVLYLATAQSWSEFVTIFVLRAVLAVPGHAIWAGIIGYYGAMKRFDGTGPGIWGGYLIAVALHGIYDLAIFLRAPLVADGLGNVANVLNLVPFLIVIGGGLLLRQMAKKALHADDHAEALAD